MPLTTRDIHFLDTLNTFFVLSRGQVQRLCYPTCGDRVVRRRLQAHVEAGLVNRIRPAVHGLLSAAPASVMHAAPA